MGFGINNSSSKLSFEAKEKGEAEVNISAAGKPCSGRKPCSEGAVSKLKQF